MKALPYATYEAATGRPHVMVDGAARPGSVLTLSHWPQSPTPLSLARDLSAEIVIDLLQAPARGGKDVRSARKAWDAAEAVTNDHFDTDGVMSVFAAAQPAEALARKNVVVAAAACGDFGVVTDDRGAQVAFALDALADKQAGPDAGTSERYSAVLPVVPELLAAPERFASFWEADYAELGAAREAIARGDVSIVEHSVPDLAVVTRRPATRSWQQRFPGADGGFPVREEAVYSNTPSTRVLAFDGEFCELRLRYEGWVRFTSRSVPKRPDLAPLADALSAREPSGTEWEANGVGAIIGVLAPSGEGRTEIPQAEIVAIVAEYLESARPAWNPFRLGGSVIPEGERHRS